MRLICCMAAVVMITAELSTGRTWAHGVVGDYAFLEPLVAEDPTPANELDILQPQWVRTGEGRTFSIGTSVEKILAKNRDEFPIFSAGIGTTWHSVQPTQGPDVSGFDDLELFAKYALLVVPEHEFLVSCAAVLQLPTGNPDVEEQNHTSLGPELLWEKGLGDLPNLPVLKYLRPLGFQSGVGYLPALGGHTSHLLFADLVAEYSLRYLSNSVRDIGLRGPLRNLYLFNEINYDQLIAGPSGQTFPHLVATPGIAYMGRYFQLSVGTQLALNGASVTENHAAVLGLLDIFYDSIFPKTNWTLF